MDRTPNGTPYDRLTASERRAEIARLQRIHDRVNGALLTLTPATIREKSCNGVKDGYPCGRPAGHKGDHQPATRKCAHPDGCEMPAAAGDIYCTDCRSAVNTGR
jgi:hypothetical protein